MFKILILRSPYGLSDAALEYQASDRLTFMRLLAIDLDGAVSGAGIVRLVPERLHAAEVFDRLFQNVHGDLSAEGVTLNNGQVGDARVGNPRGGAIPGRKAKRTRTERHRRIGRAKP